MRSKSIKLIEACFAEHDDGELTQAMRAIPYSVIGSLNNVRRILFTTKPRIISAAIENSDAPVEFGMVGRYGLPNKADVPWLRKMIRPRGLFFLGDMDPVDVMVFVWLREHLSPKYVSYLGVNDAFLNVLHVESTESLSIPCAPSEQKAFTLLDEVFPDFRETIGTKCAQLLERGSKIELEAILCGKRSIASILQSLVITKT